MSEIMVREKLETLGLYDFDGELDHVIERLENLHKTYPGKKLKLDLRRCEYDDGQEYAVLWERPENDVEKKKRLEQETASKECRQQQYLRLKKEFES